MPDLLKRRLTLPFLLMLVLPVQAAEETFACFLDTDEDHVAVPLLITEDSFYFSPTWKDAAKMKAFECKIYNKDDQGTLWGEENWGGNATIKRLAAFNAIKGMLIMDSAPHHPAINPPPRAYSCVQL